MWSFYFFDFERNYVVLKSKSPCFLLNKKGNLIKNETRSKMQNSKYSFMEMNFVLQFILKSQFKSKTVMSRKSQKKKEHTFSNVYFALRKFLQRLYLISIYRALKNFLEYIYLYIQNTLLHPY